jgi:hypothetical protein
MLISCFQRERERRDNGHIESISYCTKWGQRFIIPTDLQQRFKSKDKNRLGASNRHKWIGMEQKNPHSSGMDRTICKLSQSYNVNLQV